MAVLSQEALPCRSWSNGVTCLRTPFRRFDVGVERLGGVGEAGLRVRAVVEVHRHVQHHSIGRGHSTSGPRLQQRARCGIGARRTRREATRQRVCFGVQLSPLARHEWRCPARPREHPEWALRASRNARRGARPTRSARQVQCTPAMGSMAVVTSTHRKTALSAATRKSQDSASSKPPPNARPRTMAMVGTRSASMARYEAFILGDERAEPVDILAWPLAYFAAKAEVGSLGTHEQDADCAPRLRRAPPSSKAAENRRSRRLNGGLASTMLPMPSRRSKRMVAHGAVPCGNRVSVLMSRPAAREGLPLRG